MPRSQLIRMECDFCGDAEVFDLTQGDQKIIIPKLQKWHGVANAMAHANDPDGTKWYDSIDCISRGMKRDAEALELEKKVAVAV